MTAAAVSIDPLSAFIDAMASMGIRTADPITGDGKLRRFHVAGQRVGTKNGHYVLHLDHPASGAFGDFKSGVHETWTVEKPDRMTDADREAIRARMADTRRQRAEEQAEAHRLCREAAKAITAALEPADPAHAYLTRKRLVVTPGLKQLARDVKYTVADPEQPNRTARKGVLVIPIKGPDGVLHGVQTIGPDGRKHFLSGTNKAGHYFSIGKLTQRIIIAEGFSTSSTIHSATGLCVVIAFDAGNIKAVAKAIRAKYPTHEIVIGADNDRFTLKPVPNPGMTKACEAAAEVGGLVAWPEFDPGVMLASGDAPTDFNDLAEIRANPECVAAAFDAAMRPQDIENHTDPRRIVEGALAAVETPVTMPMSAMPLAPPDVPEVSAQAALGLRGRGFEWGSEVEIARAFHDVAARDLGSLIYCQSRFWTYCGNCWRPLDANALRRSLHLLDGADVGDGGRSGKQIKLGSRTIDGILREMSVMAGDDTFFDTPTPGIPARNCLVTFATDGRVVTVPHQLDHRRRFVIDAEFDTLASPCEPPPGSLLSRLFEGAFGGDDDALEKMLLVAEGLGAAAAGLATKIAQPKALVFHGISASNGKSSIAALAAALLPATAVCSVSPSAMSDERQVVNLAGRAANVADELGGAAIAGEALKAAITGDPLTGRDVYKPSMTFRPEALHIFTTNRLPHFTGGLDRGLQRRLVVLEFNRPIAKAAIIPNISERIAREELENLLGLAVLGASRLVRQGGYTIPASSRTALENWLRDEPLQQWATLRLSATDEKPAGGWPATKLLFQDFSRWHHDEGYRDSRLPEPNVFSKSLRGLKGVRDISRRGPGAVVVGVTLTGGQ